MTQTELWGQGLKSEIIISPSSSAASNTGGTDANFALQKMFIFLKLGVHLILSFKLQALGRLYHRLNSVMSAELNCWH